MEKITEECTGCGTCNLICPVSAINMQSSNEGFSIPVINQNICIDCGLCKKKCPQNNAIKVFNPIAYYGISSKNTSLLNQSASGGVFSTLAYNTILNGGVVYGVRYNSCFDAIYDRIDSIDRLPSILSSKYVQAYTNQIFKSVKFDLERQKKVFFCGTPCQIAGLKSYLKQNYDNLYTADLICHGVPSPLMFKHYIKWLEIKFGNSITHYNFRDKKYGWGLSFCAKTQTKTLRNSCDVDPYYHHFLKGDCYRQCCYNCKYAKKERIADITLGDFWGIDEIIDKEKCKKGWSAVIINTPIGEKLLSENINDFNLFSTNFETIVKHNLNLIRPSAIEPNIRNKFYKDINISETWFYDNVVRDFKVPLKAKVRKYIPIIIKNLLIKIK